MQDINLELESKITQVTEESGRVKSENVRLKADNDRLHEEVCTAATASVCGTAYWTV